MEEQQHSDSQQRTPVRSSGLFWRTFGMLLILVVTSNGAWLYVLSVMDEEPRARGISQRITSITTLTRYALISSDTSYRFDLIMALAQREGLVILPKESSDIVRPLPSDRVNTMVEEFVTQQLGAKTKLASSINGMPGPVTPPTRSNPTSKRIPGVFGTCRSLCGSRGHPVSENPFRILPLMD